MQTLIRRATWGARHDNGTGPRPLPITEWWLHHSVTIAPDLLPPFTDDDAAVRTLERIGEERFGRGISYTFPVTPVGRIYEGHSLDRIGSHTKGHNTVAGAFVAVGDYTKRALSAAQVEAIACRMVIEHRAGNATTHTLNGGHRDVSTTGTACPGNIAYRQIPAINRRAAELWAAGYPREDNTMPSVSEVVDGLLNADRIPAPTPSKTNPTWGVGTALEWTLRRSAQTYAVVTRMETELAALTAAVQALATSSGADPEAIAAEVGAAVRERLALITVADAGGTE